MGMVAKADINGPSLRVWLIACWAIWPPRNLTITSSSVVELAELLPNLELATCKIG